MPVLFLVSLSYSKSVFLSVTSTILYAVLQIQPVEVATENKVTVIVPDPLRCHLLSSSSPDLTFLLSCRTMRFVEIYVVMTA